MNRSAAAMNDAWQMVIAELDATRRRLVDEIIHYPPPIPRCDVQFNTLLDERAAVVRELRRAEELARRAAPDGSAAAVAEFVRESQYLSPETKRTVETSF